MRSYDDVHLVAICPQCKERLRIDTSEHYTTCPKCGENLDLDLDFARSIALHLECNHCPRKEAAVYARVLLTYPECEWALEGMKRFESKKKMTIFDYLSMIVFYLVILWMGWDIYTGMDKAPILSTILMTMLGLFVVLTITEFITLRREPGKDPENPNEDPDYLIHQAEQEYSRYRNELEERQRIKEQIDREEKYY